MKSRVTIVIIILLAFTFACEEEKVDIEKYGSLNGTILDGENFNPIYGVLVSTNPASTAGITGTNGQFRIEKIKEGEVAITAHKDKYLSNSVSVNIYEDELTFFTLVLLKDEKNVGWVEIYDPVPGNGAIDQGVSFTMKWKVDQQFPSKELDFTVYYFSSNSTVQNVAGENLNEKEVVIDNLKYGTSYYWYVVAKHEGKRVANSPTWSFKTENETTDTTKQIIIHKKDIIKL